MQKDDSCKQQKTACAAKTFMVQVSLMSSRFQPPHFVCFLFAFWISGFVFLRCTHAWLSKMVTINDHPFLETTAPGRQGFLQLWRQQRNSECGSHEIVCEKWQGSVKVNFLSFVDDPKSPERRTQANEHFNPNSVSEDTQSQPWWVNACNFKSDLLHIASTEGCNCCTKLQRICSNPYRTNKCCLLRQQTRYWLKDRNCLFPNRRRDQITWGSLSIQYEAYWPFCQPVM